MQINFNAQTVAPSQPLEVVPEGWYPVVITEDEQLAVKDKPHAWRLKITMDIIDGPMKGRKLFAGLNLGNDNPQAVEIAYRELSAICHVTGQFVLSEQTGGTAALRNKPFQVKVAIEGANNAIKGYKDMQGNDPGKTGSAAAAAPQPPASPMMPPAAAPQQPAWGAPQAAAPQAAQAPWGAPQAPQQPAPPQQPQQPAWGAPQQPQAQPQAQQWQQPAAQPPQPAAAAPWGGGAPAPQAAQPAPAGRPAWAPGAAPPGAAPWGR